jgi:hypothetical protein
MLAVHCVHSACMYLPYEPYCYLHDAFIDPLTIRPGTHSTSPHHVIERGEQDQGEL